MWEADERDRTSTMVTLPDGQDADLESVSLIWLDAAANASEANIATQKRFRLIIHQFRVFTNVQDCEQFIRSKCSNDRTHLIVSGICGQEMVPRIEQCRQLSAVYVYCRDKERNEAWSKYFPKVMTILYTREKELSTDVFGFDWEHSHALASARLLSLKLTSEREEYQIFDALFCLGERCFRQIRCPACSNNHGLFWQTSIQSRWTLLDSYK